MNKMNTKPDNRPCCCYSLSLDISLCHVMLTVLIEQHTHAHTKPHNTISVGRSKQQQ